MRHYMISMIGLFCLVCTVAFAAPRGGTSRVQPSCNDPDKEGTSQEVANHTTPGTTEWVAFPKAGASQPQSGVDTCKTPKLLYEYHCEQYKGLEQLPTNTDNMRTMIDCSAGGAVCKGGRCVTSDSKEGDGSCAQPCSEGTLCKQGKCIPPEQAVKCEGACGIFGCPACPIDTADCSHNNGEDPFGSEFIGGTIQFAQGSITGIPATDECLDGIWLLEYDCVNGAKTETTIQCADGCDLATGTCLKTDCTDPDANAGTIEVLWESFDKEYAYPSKVTQQNQYGQVIAQKPDECADDWHVKEAYCNGKTPDYKTGECPEEIFGHDVFDGCCDGACYVAKDKCIDTDSDTDNGLAPKTAGALFVGKGCGLPPETARDTCGVATLAGNVADGSQLKSYMVSGDYGDSVKEFYCDGLEVTSVWVYCGSGPAGTAPLNAKSVDDAPSAATPTKLPSAQFTQQSDNAPPSPSKSKDQIAACHQGQCAALARCHRTEQKFWASSTTGLLIAGGQATTETRNDECIDDQTLREYHCADTAQWIPTASSKNFAQPALYMVPVTRSCLKGCDAQQGKCTENVIDLGKKLIPVPSKLPRMP